MENEKGQSIRDENGYVVKVVPTKEQWRKFLTPLIPAARELILKRKLEQRKREMDDKDI
ncbi:hypothetical protein [Bacillus cereus]|uniref:Uncharacterized protein n=1 Tax=Bacillus cereus TaxID=1396 RepID=A0A0G8EFG7_BACCE|nr:hypothetical protein [Bacillus cereus]KLA22222.1 hypothetical protein B4077_3168 [Bacillus cereus]